VIFRVTCTAGPNAVVEGIFFDPPAGTLTTPTITWANPSDIVAGTALSATQLNASASVPGTFVYTPPAGTVLSAGANQTLSATFQPTDTAHYLAASASVKINVTATSRITVTAPNTGVSWTSGTSHAITWTHNLPAGATVTLDVSRNSGTTWTTIASNVANATSSTGTFNWLVTGPSTGQGRIRVRQSTSGSVSDMSDVDFSIVNPAVTVTSPNGSGALHIGAVWNITFTDNLGTGAQLKIDVSRDGGATWSSITTLTTTSATSGSYAWTVSGPPTARARIRVSWTDNTAVFDQSDVNFTIGP